MATSIFIFEGISTGIQCLKEQKMKYICEKYSNKINVNINSLLFLYGGTKLNMDRKYEEYSKENIMKILVYRNENEVCLKCGKLLDNKKIDDLILSYNSINSILIGLKSQIDTIINDSNKQINEIINQLKNINFMINHIIENIKKNNKELNMINNGNNLNEIKNEIICIYDKQKDEIDLLHHFNEDTNNWYDNAKNAYIEGKNNINERNIDIFINDKKIIFNTKYKSKEIGDIKVKFKFNKLLTSTSYMFRCCSSLTSIDLSSFNSSNVNNMRGMFYSCSSLKSVNLSSFNTNNVNNMRGMFKKCTSLQSLDLSSFDITKANNLDSMFANCYNLKFLDLSSFDTTNININNMSNMFDGCCSLKKQNVKVNDKKILEQLLV